MRVAGEDKPAYKTVMPSPDAASPAMQKKAPKPQPVPENQHALFDESTDFSAKPTEYGLYKCKQCGKLVMSFSLDEHTGEVHGGRDPGYEKLK